MVCPWVTVMMATNSNHGERQKPATTEARGLRSVRDFRDLSHQILQRARRSISRFDFLQEVLKMLVDSSGCDRVELWLKGTGSRLWTERHADSKRRSKPQTAPLPGNFTVSDHQYVLWTGNLEEAAAETPGTQGQARLQEASMGGRFKSIALVPLVAANENAGLLQLQSVQRNYFTQETIDLYDRFARTLAFALTSQQMRAALYERVKELTCLYGIANIAGQPGISLTEILDGIVEFLPPAWQYPVITFGRIVLDGHTYSTPGFPEDGQRMTTSIVVGGKCRGFVEVIYAETKPDLDEGPFLSEERSLIEAVARQTALIVERRQVEEEGAALHEQLRRADRLATIGQLAAGVAHELNEPLGNILGLAQLAKKCSGLPEEVAQDLDDIVEASLHSREVIKKLMMLARQAPTVISNVNLNEVVNKALYFLEARSSKSGVELRRELSPSLPEISADPAQLSQILINLVVNAMQAMPDGGCLIVRTLAGADHVLLIVEDTGVGMSEEVLEQIFLPFFTTKDIDQGTGLGLAVVHGIVTAHQGRIQVSSQIGRGSRFEIQLPVGLPVNAKEGK